VSTDKQGADGYGIEAQRPAVATYLNGGAWTMLKEFVEVESGKVNGASGVARGELPEFVEVEQHWVVLVAIQ
jgi:hypothetical protein